VRYSLAGSLFSDGTIGSLGLGGGRRGGGDCGAVVVYSPWAWSQMSMICCCGGGRGEVGWPGWWTAQNKTRVGPCSPTKGKPRRFACESGMEPASAV
jgi:hypothetical protein